MLARQHLLHWLTTPYRQPDPLPNSGACIYSRSPGANLLQLLRFRAFADQAIESPYPLNHDLRECGAPWQRMTKMAQKRTVSEVKIIVLIDLHKRTSVATQFPRPPKPLAYSQRSPASLYNLPSENILGRAIDIGGKRSAV